jgi:hypothetical protein
MEREDHSPDASDDLPPDLRRVEEELEQRLEEVCAKQEVGDETTAELIRLEETLEDAARAAKQAISLRRRARVEREQPLERGGDTERAFDRPAGVAEAGPVAAVTEGEEDTGVREFRDREGREWRVWAVMPHLTQSRTGAARFMGEYTEGWLAFESVDQALRKRLPHFPDDWRGRDENGLRELLDRAHDAQHRPKGRGPEEARS